jgi:hypothetical protein
MRLACECFPEMVTTRRARLLNIIFYHHRITVSLAPTTNLTYAPYDDGDDEPTQGPYKERSVSRSCALWACRTTLYLKVTTCALSESLSRNLRHASLPRISIPSQLRPNDDFLDTLSDAWKILNYRSMLLDRRRVPSGVSYVMMSNHLLRILILPFLSVSCQCPYST